MTDTIELDAILELAVLQLLDWGAVTSCFVPDDTTDADLDVARVIVRRRLRESSRLDLVQRLDTAIIETGVATSNIGPRRIMMLQWEA